MRTYTIDGTEYLTYKDSLFTVEETVTAISDLSEENVYWHDGTVGTFELKSAEWEAFDAVFVPTAHPDNRRHYVLGDDGRGREFQEAVVLSRVVPDQLATCPECGSAAGEKDDSESPKCLSCGYGFEDE